jgi:hypothetical protein
MRAWCTSKHTVTYWVELTFKRALMRSRMYRYAHIVCLTYTIDAICYLTLPSLLYRAFVIPSIYSKDANTSRILYEGIPTPLCKDTNKSYTSKLAKGIPTLLSLCTVSRTLIQRQWHNTSLLTHIQRYWHLWQKDSLTGKSFTRR